MIRRTACLLLLCLAIQSCAASAPQLPPVGTIAGQAGGSAPQFRLKDLRGQERTLEQLRGKVTLVHFWATWCAPCAHELQTLQNLYQPLSERGLSIVAIATEKDLPPIAKRIELTGATYTTLVDPWGSVQGAYGVTSLPQTFIVDAKGDFLNLYDTAVGAQTHRIVGAREWDQPEFVGEIERLLVD